MLGVVPYAALRARTRFPTLGTIRHCHRRESVVTIQPAHAVRGVRGFPGGRAVRRVARDSTSPAPWSPHLPPNSAFGRPDVQTFSAP